VSPAPTDQHWSGNHVLIAWGILTVSVAIALTQVPWYLDSLDQRIVFAQPDCLAVVGDSAAALELTTAQRADSLTPWTRDCLRIRQDSMLGHAQKVGWATTLALVVLSVFTLAITLAWAWGRFRAGSE
jgi:hypothetical protein